MITHQSSPKVQNLVEALIFKLNSHFHHEHCTYAVIETVRLSLNAFVACKATTTNLGDWMGLSELILSKNNLDDIYFTMQAAIKIIESREPQGIYVFDANGEIASGYPHGLHLLR
jgi:hypothetical protein